MTKKNKSKRNKEQDYFPSLYMMQDDYPVNKYDGLSMPTQNISQIATRNTGNTSSPQLTGLQPNSCQAAAKYGTAPQLNKESLGSSFSENFKNMFSTEGLNVLGNAAASVGAGALGTLGGNLISGGKSSGVGNAIGDVGGAIGGAAMMVNPVLGGAVMLGSKLIGGGINALFGSKMNYENINRIENELNQSRNYNSSATNFDELTQEIMSAPSIGYFSKSDIGSDGLFSNKASRKFRELSARKKFVEDWITRSQANSATNLQQNQLNDQLMGWFAYGGPLDYNYGFGGGAIGYDLANQQLGIDNIKAMGQNRQYSLPNLGLNTFAEGGGIHIKPSKRGTFTAAAKKHGKGVQEFASQVLANKENYSPAMVKKANFARNAAKWHHAFGGDLLTNGTVFSNGVTTIGNGGTHEESPYEGVQMGIDPQGIPNLVEEGELIWNDYVFSNRISVPDAVRNKYKLRGTKDMSFSDAAKKIQKASEERPNDPIAQDTLGINLSRLAQEQETIREQKNMEQNRQYATGGILGNKGNLFFTGGPYEYGQNPLNMENYSDLSSLYKQGSDYMNKRQYIIDNWDTDYVKNWIKDTYIPFVQNYNKSRGYNSNFTVNLDQFTKGTYDNQYGGMHKGVLDFIIPETNRKKQSPTMNIYTTRGRKGGDISINPEALDFYGYSVPQDIIETTKDSEGNTINYLQSLTNNNSKISNRLKKENKREDKESPLTSRWFDETVLRYAPVVGSAIGLGQTLLSNPDYSRADALAQYAQNAGNVTPISYDPLGNYLTYRPNDVEYIANKMAAQAAATRRGIMNTSGGNRAFALAGLAAQDYSSQLAQAEAIRQADESNFNRGVQVETFNRGTNQYNSEAALKAAMANQEAKLKASQLGLSGYSTAMQMKDAIDAQRNASISANLTNLFDSLGNIGIDAYNRKDRDMLLRAGVFGTLGEKPQGWSEKRWTDYKKALNGTGYRNGGKLKKKRGGFTY